jgi:YD repeat-containing protein
VSRKATPQAVDRVTSYSYATLPDGNEWQAVRDMTTGQRTVSAVDRAGNVLWSGDARGRRTNYTTDGEGRALATVDADGNRVENIYDVFGRVYKEYSHRAGVTENGRPANQLTYYTYDDAGRTIEVVRRKANPDGSDGPIISTTRNEYESDSNGRIETQIDSLGRKSRSIYDGEGGRLTRTESYDAAGRLVDWTAYEYDLLGRTVKTENRRGVINETEYDTLGRVQRKIEHTRDGAYRTESVNTYDAAGRLETVNTDGHLTRNEYDPLGRVTKVWYDELLLKETECDANTGQVKKVGEPIDATSRTATLYGYNTLGQQTDVWLGYASDQAMGLHFGFDFDAFGNQVAFKDPLWNVGNGHERTKEYDSKGRLTRELGPKGNDASGALTNRRWLKRYEYYSSGQLRKLSEGTAAANGTDEKTTRSVEYVYDPWTGAQSEAKYSDGRRITKQYLPDGRTDRVDIFEGTVKVYWKQYAYDPASGSIFRSCLRLWQRSSGPI